MNALTRRGSVAIGHVQRAIASVGDAVPNGDRDWCVCRFVNGAPGWPLKNLSRGTNLSGQAVAQMCGFSLGWSKDAPVEFFTKAEAEGEALRFASPISVDRAVHVSAIRWKVRIYSHYDGSDAVHETDSYAEALSAFTLAASVRDRENTTTVAYLVASIEGATDGGPQSIECGSAAPLLGAGHP